MSSLLKGLQEEFHPTPKQY